MGGISNRRKLTLCQRCLSGSVRSRESIPSLASQRSARSGGELGASMIRLHSEILHAVQRCIGQLCINVRVCGGESRRAKERRTTALPAVPPHGKTQGIF